MRSLTWFLMGAVFGVCLVGGTLWGLADSWARHGVHIQGRADGIDLAGRVVDSLEEQALTRIQEVLSEIEDEVAREVSRRMAGSLREAGITVYGVEIILPEESTRNLEEGLGNMLSDELSRSLSDWPWEDVIRDWSEEAETFLEEAMSAGSPQIIMVDVGPYHSLPVHIELESPSR